MKAKWLKSALLVVMLAGLALPASAALAETGPAVVIDDAFCNLLDVEGNVFVTSGAHIVISNDKNGNVKYVCQAQQPALVDNPTKAVLFDAENTGGQCGTGEGLTDDWEIAGDAQRPRDDGLPHQPQPDAVEGRFSPRYSIIYSCYLLPHP